MEIPDIDASFFREEERLGFTVSSMMKRAWACHMRTLCEVDKVCERHGLKYYMDYGSLLGAVRHGGFIPWDDDLDISMMRKDYMEFIKYAPSELPASYLVSSLYRDEVTYQPFICGVLNRREVDVDKELTREFYGCPYICGIDIFPIDNIPEDPDVFNAFKELYMVFYDAFMRFDELTATGEMDEYIPRMEELIGFPIERGEGLRKNIASIADGISSMYMDEETPLIGNMREIVIDGKPARSAQWYERNFTVPFEMTNVRIPGEPYEVLKYVYGPEFGKVVKASAMHDYPFYKKQEEARFRVFGPLETE
ncbi:MAG: LicD family protein [Eubacterium sp.]|nr:LicD family protein [Eubacterium sp.]